MKIAIIHGNIPSLNYLRKRLLPFHVQTWTTLNRSAWYGLVVLFWGRGLQGTHLT